MFTDSPEAFVAAAQAAPLKSQTTLKAALLVQDPDYAVATETAADNLYMNLDEPAAPGAAFAQQTELAAELRRCGVPTVIFGPLEGASDGIFPNNAFATTPGKLILGSMRYPNRQRETRRQDVRDWFTGLLGSEVVDLSLTEGTAELTGALVIDHARGVGFCGLSERADVAGAKAMHEAFGLKATLHFPLPASEYHTNVVLSLLAGRAAVVYADEPAYEPLQNALDGLYGEWVHYLKAEEKDHFVANCLAVTPEDVVMSETAWRNCLPETVDFFSRAGFNVRSVDVSELEKAGGSVRCMIGEIF